VGGDVCGQDVGRGTRITGEGGGEWCSTSIHTRTAQLHGAASGMNKRLYVDKERKEEMEKKKKKKRKTENNTIIRYYSSSTVYSIIRIRFLAVRASTCTVLHAALWVCTSCRKYDSSCVTPRVAFLRFQSACRRRIREQGNTLLFERSIHIIRSAPVLCSSSSPPPHPRFFFFSSLLPSAIGIASEL